MPQRLFNLISTIWVGSLLTTGYLVAPTLFALLSETDAGRVAANLFHTQAYVSVVSGIVLLLIANRVLRMRDAGASSIEIGAQALRRARRVIIAMIACTLVGYFALQPWMNALRIAAQTAGTDISHSAYKTQFGALHGVSMVFYLLESVLGVWLVCMRGVRASVIAPA
ncbi:DUF4149 domain-containing protein [Pararobbsia silviterrae]|uniref:DUF4149 domain-containing protein n=1 Tax=Pararobbsia silviterrae TaxID=1792498 RepID=A0A494Y8W6_9BURK|nr:DUF4149 domain-containing protein [Pararobbsia silviterrae]RKP56756.1 DUF4149 domain-containing protein [Pararobbsia silviterrae]